MTTRLISVAEARRRVLAASKPLGEERIAVEEGIGRALAREVSSSGDVPPFPSSAMDGFAVKAGKAGRELEVIGEARAGSPCTLELGDPQAIRISTGAVVPTGAEAVIRQEDTEQRDSSVRTTAPVAEGQNIRRAGEDMPAGSTVLSPGTRIDAAALGAAIAAGASELMVACQPRVEILCTGDELRRPGKPLGSGQIYNSNGPMLASLARRAGAFAAPARQVADEAAQLEVSLRVALEASDVVILSGGVSVGPHDHVKRVLAKLGVDEVFWGVALQPGKPTWFGTYGQKLVFGLPGNPVSAVVTFALFARPALASLQGLRPDQAFPRRARLGNPVRCNPSREQALRVGLEDREDYILAHPTGAQGSHRISSLLGADALAMIPPGDGTLDAGATVSLEALSL